MLSIQNVKAYMKENNITYQQLSDWSKIPLNTLKNLFRGKTKNPRIDTMQAIERALGLSTQQTPSDKLTETERELLTAFRVLNSTMQAYVLQIVKGAVSTQEKTATEHERKNKNVGA